ncbi:MAG TPA: ATP-binding cassette domain-containing protein [Thermoanaerobaculia bacterium]
MSDTTLKVSNVVKTFDKVKAVDGVSFDVRRGTITGLLGRNGAGKTTTIRMITGILLPDSGSIESPLGGNGQRFRDRVGYLPEERGLYKQMRILDHLLFLGELKQCRGARARVAAERWLRRFELWEKRDAKVEELSKGNQQKVQIAAALLHDPELIILDEPQSGLDPVNMILVRDLLRELKREGKTILLSTHMMGEAEKLADEIVVIHGGRTVLSGTVDEVRASSGRKTLQIEFDGDGAFLGNLPHVGTAKLTNRSAELTLAEGGHSQDILHAAAAKLYIRRFEMAIPSLEDIFVEKVGGQTLARAASEAN